MDISEFPKVLFPLFSPSELSLEFAGLIFAILSFTGATHRIENLLWKLRQRIFLFLPIMRIGIAGFVPTLQNIRRNARPLMESALLTLILCVVLMLTEPETRQMLFNLYKLGTPWTWPKFVVAAIVVPVILYLTMIVMSIVFFGSVYIFLTIVWFVFWLLSRPPAGVMGSLGLALTIATFSIKLLAG